MNGPRDNATGGPGDNPKTAPHRRPASLRTRLVSNALLGVAPPILLTGASQIRRRAGSAVAH